MKNHQGNTMRESNQKKFKKMNMIIFGLASLLWLIFRTGTKPTRIIYPCQKAALVSSSILVSISIPLSLASGWVKTKKFLSKKGTTILLIIILLAVILNSEQYLGNIQPAGAVDPNQELYLSLESRDAVTLPASNIYVVEGRSYAYINELVNLMGLHGMYFFESSTTGLNQGPEGLIAYDDLVLIKINSQWDGRGGTNTDLLKELIQIIVDHPDGFLGEIVVADNGQAQYGSSGNGGNLNWVNNNAEDQSQSAQDVVDMFAGSYNVSTYLWDTITLQSASEYPDGDFNDGYVINKTDNSKTGIQVSYPKFRTKFGTYISFKSGIWNPITESYNSEKLKIINFPVLKSHFVYGVTATVKHYMGVVSAKQTNAHAKVATGGMGTEMVETRFPTLNILDAIWVNANPAYSSYCGPSTPYGVATRVNTIMASTDPVALAYWGSKNILMQTAELTGYTDTNSINPDYTARSGVSGEVFGVWLELAKNEIASRGYNVTTEENQMNVYVKSEVPPPEIGVPTQIPSRDTVRASEEVKVSVTVTDANSGVKNVTLFYSINSGTFWESRIMKYNTSTKLYEATIPGQQDETRVNFRIVAYNNAGISATKDGTGQDYTYQVIPEFPSWIILPLFLTTALIGAIYRKKLIT